MYLPMKSVTKYHTNMVCQVDSRRLKLETDSIKLFDTVDTPRAYI